MRPMQEGLGTRNFVSTGKEEEVQVRMEGLSHESNLTYAQPLFFIA